ncbi:hypothetical protein HGRIS_003412 [Hohenbuehelia grisea]|uniref:F-box domain-containing protein n=1 Tax=Hohenbuehelia grisea TaxID=104357 RepID=A0ABR3JGC8_9AGAR
MSVKTILDLPKDVALLIFEAIVHDPGRLGGELRALSLVSHAMRRSVAPVLYRYRCLGSNRERTASRAVNNTDLDAFSRCSDLLRHAARHVRVKIYDRQREVDDYSQLFEFIASLQFLKELKYADESSRPAQAFLMVQQLLLALDRGCPELYRLKISFERLRVPSVEKNERASDLEIEKALQATASGIKNLTKLGLQWALDDSLFADQSAAQLACLITTSSETLRELDLKIDDWYGVEPDLQLLKNIRGLEVLCISSPLRGGEIYGEIADVAPGLRRLEVKLDSRRRPIAALPFASDPHYHVFGKFLKLQQLRISFDLEKSARDSLKKDHDLPWYIRCLKRRRIATQSLARICPHLEECYWIMYPADSEGNSMTHRFRIVTPPGSESGEGLGGSSADQRADRLVQTYKDEYMMPFFRNDWGNEEFPPDMIVHPDILHRWLDPKEAGEVAKPALGIRYW